MTSAPPIPSHAGLDAVLLLDEGRAADASLTGAKAARIAEAATAGLPTVPGFVITTAASHARDGMLVLRAGFESQLRDAFDQATADGSRSLAVRSSSVIEDATASSMAGQFLSVLDVRGWEGFQDAVRRVLDSASLDGTAPQPMAVLVQPMVDVIVGGVLFGLDPVTGNRRHLVVEAVPGSPEALVSGQVTAARYVLDRRGRLLESDAPDGLLDARQRRALARLHHRSHAIFDGPQDIEWAWDRTGALRMLQSRPVTTAGPTSRAVGPVLGPGPVGETLPDVLDLLEADLWVEPIRRGVTVALRAAGAASEAQLQASPVITTVGGRVAADLELLGVQRERPSPLSRLDPRGPARHLAVSWRVGRLRAALPRLIDDLLDQADEDLAAVPAVTALTTPQLIGLIGRGRALLAAVHGHEVLAGMLLTERETGTGAALAMSALARARADGLDDAAAIAQHPAVLALTPPRLGGPAPLPRVEPGTEHVRPSSLSRREALRLRARWIQELVGRAAEEAGARFAATGAIPAGADVRLLRLPELTAIAAGSPAPGDLEARRHVPASPPLPAVFRRTATGEVVPMPSTRDGREGRGAGGGRGCGPVRLVDDLAHLARGDVLVVRTLEPGLAPALPRLGGLVSETGSTLSHLAILARELQVPTVVAVPDAVHRFPAGSTVVVDGTTGSVAMVEEVAS